VVTAADESLFLERGKMLVHGRERGELQRVRDFLEARRIAVLINEANQVVQHFFLPFRQRHSRPPRFAQYSPPLYRRIKSEVNGTCGQLTFRGAGQARGFCGAKPEFVESWMSLSGERVSWRRCRGHRRCSVGWWARYWRFATG